MKKDNRNFLLLSIVLILVATSMRLINKEFGLYHLAPLAAMGLFSGAVIKNRTLAYMVPLVSYLISDLLLELIWGRGAGFYGLSQFFVYAGMIGVVFLGSKMGRIKPLKVLGFSVMGSMIFWIISNFGVWIEGYTYPLNLSGLVTCYLMALPFYTDFGTTLFFNSFLGDLLFNSLLFGVYTFAISGLNKTITSKVN